jgi:signal transduction histidine kinase
MSPRLRVYVTCVILAATGLLALGFPDDLAQHWAHYLGWIVICVLAETMWLPTASGEGTVTMASTAGIAAAMLWGLEPAMWVVAASTLLADLLILRKPWIRATFNAAQSAITIGLALYVWSLLGAPLGGLEAAQGMRQGEATAMRLVPPILGIIATYWVMNRVLVAVAVAWSSGRGYLQVWREDWLYAERLLDDLAAFFLSPLMVIAFQAVGYMGVILFYIPLRMVNESTRRYLELRGAQQQLIHGARMAAKGEIAAEVGHELRNQLVAISGRAQMLQRDADREVYSNVRRHADIILEQSKRMEVMSKNLMDFSGREVKMERADINELVRRSVEFVHSQNRFDGVEWDVRLTDGELHAQVDPGQIQQVLLNLFMNAADAMNEKAGRRKLIGVTTHLDERRRNLRLIVTDTGPGIAGPVLPRVFEPHFTTKPDGHGFGLSTSYRIIENHRGTIEAESPPGHGATFVITLPLHAQGGWADAA